MKHLIYEPQANATPDEVLQVLKVFTVPTIDKCYLSKHPNMLLDTYETLPLEAKRHFKVIEE
jgi:hypothetical protein